MKQSLNGLKGLDGSSINPVSYEDGIPVFAGERARRGLFSMYGLPCAVPREDDPFGIIFTSYCRIAFYDMKGTLTAFWQYRMWPGRSAKHPSGACGYITAHESPEF